MVKKVVMVLTNHGNVEGHENKNTGWYLPECAHPYYRFVHAGYEVEFASILGGLCPVSQSSLDMNDAENKSFWETESTKQLTENTKKLADVDLTTADIIFYVGGFGTMWDFPFHEVIATSAKQVYEQGGIVGAVCHGPIALANVTLSNGQYLVANQPVTAFSNEEETYVKDLSDFLPEHVGLGRTCEDVLSARGGKYSKAAGAWGCHVCVGDRLFTGQNPASAAAVATAIVEAVGN